MWPKQVDIDSVDIGMFDLGNISSFYVDDMMDIEFSYSADFRNTKKIRDILGKIFDYLGIDGVSKIRSVLMIDELNNNAIEHGSNPGDTNFMRFQAIKLPEYVQLNIEVEDSGKGNKTAWASKKMQKLQKEKKQKGFENHRDIRGRGLFLIIEKLVDKLYFQDAENGWLIVGIEKKYVKIPVKS